MHSSKLPEIGTTIFTVMSQMAMDYKAINLAQGFPDFPCAEQLRDLVAQAIHQGWNQYSPMTGLLALRERIAEKTQYLYGYLPSVQNEITVTCGATEACYAAITAFVGKGDEVIIFEPAFDCYVPTIKLHGGKPVFVGLSYPEYNIPWDEVKAKITDRTRMIIINSPHNPTGAAISKNDLIQLQELVRDTNIIVLSDEVYEHIIFDGKEHESVLRFPELRERSLVISSFGKTFHSTGWRIGYCVAPEALSREFRKMHQYITFSAPTPMQMAISEFLKDKNHYLALPSFYQQKRDKFLELVKDSRFKAQPSAGTFFQLLSYKDISDEKDTDFAARVAKEYGVAAIPISVFYHNGKDEKLLRFCFAKEDETLVKAAEKLCRI